MCGVQASSHQGKSLESLWHPATKSSLVNSFRHATYRGSINKNKNSLVHSEFTWVCCFILPEAPALNPTRSNSFLLWGYRTEIPRVWGLGTAPGWLTLPLGLRAELGSWCKRTSLSTMGPLVHSPSWKKIFFSIQWTKDLKKKKKNTSTVSSPPSFLLAWELNYWYFFSRVLSQVTPICFAHMQFLLFAGLS